MSTDITPSPTTLAQVDGIREAREIRRHARRERSKWLWLVDDALDTIATHPDWTITISGDHRPRPVPPPAPPAPTLADRARDYLEGRADESIESILEDVIEYVEACESGHE